MYTIFCEIKYIFLFFHRKVLLQIKQYLSNGYFVQTFPVLHYKFFLSNLLQDE